MAISMSRRHLDFPAAAGGEAGGAVQQHIGQRHIGQAGLAFVIGDVAGGVAVKLQQTDTLAGAGEGRARDIGCPEVAAHVGAARARSRRWEVGQASRLSGWRSLG